MKKKTQHTLLNEYAGFQFSHSQAQALLVAAMNTSNQPLQLDESSKIKSINWDYRDQKELLPYGARKAQQF